MFGAKLAGLSSGILILGAAEADSVVERAGLGFAALAMLFYFLKQLFNRVLIPWTKSSIETQKGIQQAQASITRNQELIASAIDKVIVSIDKHQRAVELHMATDTATDARLSQVLDEMTKKFNGLGCAQDGA